MTINQAIEILDLNLREAGKLMPPSVKDAVSLSIQALKRVKWHKEQHTDGYYELLPGETDAPTQAP